MVDKQVHLKVKPAGFIRMYSKKAYKEKYGRDGGEDGLQLEDVTLPDGNSAQVFKVSCQL